MNEIFNIIDNLCPFCKTELEYSYVHCPDNALIPCLECKKCHYYFYTDDDYKLLSNVAKAHNRKLNQHVLTYREPMLNNISKSQKEISKQIHKKTEQGSRSSITTIVLNDNRKCIYNNHNIQDINATLKISTQKDGVIDKVVNIAYCKTCELYFMLKREYKSIKEQGAILCEVIDYTTKTQSKKSVSISSNESRIHRLGYNVAKENNYTDTQRQAILAHIIENTDISKHEIESCIARPMKQHINQQNYSNAVACWSKDLEFVRGYQKGDMPEVIIGKIIVGKRI